MNWIRLTIALSSDEAQALIGIAQVECRHPREQARMLIRLQLEKLGRLRSQGVQDPACEGEGLHDSQQ